MGKECTLGFSRRSGGGGGGGRSRDENKECLHSKLPAARSSDFVITRIITDRIGLHSVLFTITY